MASAEPAFSADDPGPSGDRSPRAGEERMRAKISENSTESPRSDPDEAPPFRRGPARAERAGESPPDSGLGAGNACELGEVDIDVGALLSHSSGAPTLGPSPSGYSSPFGFSAILRWRAAERSAGRSESQ